MSGVVIMLSQLAKLVFKLLMISHMMSIGWILVGKYQLSIDQDENTWIGEVNSFQEVSIDKIYIKSFYFVICTMSTIGYGDVIPVNMNEQIFIIISSFIACGAFALAVNTVGSILQELSANKQKLNQRMACMNQYMKKHNLNNQLQLKVKKYFEYLYMEEEKDENSARQMINQLESTLKEQVLIDLYQGILQKNKSFALNFSQKFIKKLALVVDELTLGPEELIFREGDYPDRIYFILKGNVETGLLNKTNENEIIPISTLQEGNCFGEFGFISQMERQYLAKTVNVTQLAFIDYQEFEKLIKEDEQDFEKYHQMKDKLRFNKTYVDIHFKCPICRSYQHLFKDCNYIFKVIDRELVQLREIYQFQISGQDRFKTDEIRKPKRLARVRSKSSQEVVKQFVNQQNLQNHIRQMSDSTFEDFDEFQEYLDQEVNMEMFNSENQNQNQNNNFNSNNQLLNMKQFANDNQQISPRKSSPQLIQQNQQPLFKLNSLQNQEKDKESSNNNNFINQQEQEQNTGINNNNNNNNNNLNNNLLQNSLQTIHSLQTPNLKPTSCNNSTSNNNTEINYVNSNFQVNPNFGFGQPNSNVNSNINQNINIGQVKQQQPSISSPNRILRNNLQQKKPKKMSLQRTDSNGQSQYNGSCQNPDSPLQQQQGGGGMLIDNIVLNESVVANEQNDNQSQNTFQQQLSNMQFGGFQNTFNNISHNNNLGGNNNMISDKRISEQLVYQLNHQNRFLITQFKNLGAEINRQITKQGAQIIQQNKLQNQQQQEQQKQQSQQELYVQKKEEFLIIENLDKMILMTKYFKHNNYDVVLKKHYTIFTRKKQKRLNSNVYQKKNIYKYRKQSVLQTQKHFNSIHD